MKGPSSWCKALCVWPGGGFLERCVCGRDQWPMAMLLNVHMRFGVRPAELERATQATLILFIAERTLIRVLKQESRFVAKY